MGRFQIRLAHGLFWCNRSHPDLISGFKNSLPHVPSRKRNNPFLIGLRAARANLVPGLVIQAMMLGIVLAYYFWPASRGCFQALADLKARWGFVFSFVSASIAGALLPTIFKVAVINRGKVTRADFSELLFLAIFWGIDGVMVDVLYRGQALMFGTGINFGTLVKKVLFDQFVFSPLISAPLTLICYEWRKHGLRLRHDRHGGVFSEMHVIPTVCALWGVWIPVLFGVYALPSLLQVPLFALVLTFWVLMMAYLTSRQSAGHPCQNGGQSAICTPQQP